MIVGGLDTMKKPVIHPFEPIYDIHSKVLILGSMPSPKSRELGFYYGHPQNRFWKVLATIFEESYPDTIEKKKMFVLKHHLALWDVIESCKIDGASDSSITNVKVNNLAMLVEQTEICYIITTGKKAEALYKKYCEKEVGISSICLPSTSPANCAVKEKELVDAYRILKEYTK